MQGSSCILRNNSTNVEHPSNDVGNSEVMFPCVTSSGLGDLYVPILLNLLHVYMPWEKH